MGRFTGESLEQLRQRVDLIDLLGSHLDLKRAGASYKACCPFHDEKTPSFMVQRGDSHYHCFGCGAHGDAIEFLMSFLKLNFVEAVEYLADRYNARVEREEGEATAGPDRRRLKSALKAACDLYHTHLLESEEGKGALAYLEARGLDLEFIQRFQVGLAPRHDGQILKALYEQKFDNNSLREVGLLSARGREFFYDRILFPICDASGAVIGFSGRSYREDTHGGKYVNTPETPLFYKSRVLFGLNHSRRRIAKERRAIVVEGQIDALRLIHAGIDIAVAGQGTAFGSGQVQELLKLGVREIFLALDGDEAGREAAVKIGNLFQKEGVGVKVALFPTDSDPDVILSKEGTKGIFTYLRESLDYLTFVVRYLGSKVQGSPAGKTELVRRIADQIRTWDDPVMVHESLRKLAALTQLPEEVVGVTPAHRPSPHQRTISLGSTSINADQVLEADVLRWLILLAEREPWVLEMTRLNLTSEHFRIDACRQIFDAYMAGDVQDLLGLAAKVGSEQIIADIVDRKINRDRAREQYPEAIRKLLERNWMDEREAIRHQIQAGDQDGDQVLELVKKFDRLKSSPPEIQCT
jgi:DNA primase